MGRASMYVRISFNFRLLKVNLERARAWLYEVCQQTNTSNYENC